MYDAESDEAGLVSVVPHPTLLIQPREVKICLIGEFGMLLMVC